MHLDLVAITFKLIAFLFAISVHESAHAWTASRCGDQTARMLGRVTLNPIKHIDPIGTILLPLIGAYYRVPLLGWAKPTPVDPRNFRNPVRDDILTSVAGPVSNFIVSTGALVLLWLISLTSQLGSFVVHTLPHSASDSVLVPIAQLLFWLMVVNVWLAVFNLIPLPPLDGSHVVRHFLSDAARRAYDNVGMLALFALVLLAPGILSILTGPFVDFYVSMAGRF